ncbi:outer membrane protein [Sphingobium boeckii]|uniref:Outer membrane immunogenic protein n=1 Tax=Sphingobium boeckii TaxID=1082345 RepID=A0A7W9AJV4_9SPHN|nr:outer membrane beta-barrel protein [Sphingobium boeckii]MBB5687029.1 outer membrane immunogenic protein [Sphingobium boeckii]
MRTKFIVSALALSMGLAATPAFAQSTAEETGYNGVYVGGSFGASLQGNDNGSSILFDNNLDGTFGDTVNTAAVPPVNAFSPGFCNGRPTSTAPGTGCTNDKDDIEYYGNIGFDRQMGSFVIGAVGEFGKSELSDSVTAFSTTPASYTMTRKLKYNAGLRLRAGYTPNNTTLFYVTGGGAYAKVKNSFTTTNTANSFSDNGNSDAWGYSAGGGVEQKIGQNFSIGLQYLYTDLKDNDYRVAVGPGTALPTNPFLLANPAGTDFRRSDDNFRFHSIRATAAFRF